MTAMPIRTRTIERKTRETEITVTVELDGAGSVDVETGVPFLDHMLDALGRHGQLNLRVRCAGDVEIDPHHSVEDVGIVIGMAGSGNRANFTVRKISYGVGVERIFPLHSPRIDKVEVVARGKVRRAKLYFLRDRSGKAARLVGEEG